MAALAVLALAGCGRGISLPDAEAYPAPVAAATREDPADSLQLEAVPVRDTAGLEATEPSADADLLASGLAALQAAVPGVTSFDRISVYGDSLFVGFAVPDQPGRSASASYFPDGRLNVSDPSPSRTRRTRSTASTCRRPVAWCRGSRLASPACT